MSGLTVFGEVFFLLLALIGGGWLAMFIVCVSVAAIYGAIKDFKGV